MLPFPPTSVLKWGITSCFLLHLHFFPPSGHFFLNYNTHSVCMCVLTSKDKHKLLLCLKDDCSLVLDQRDEDRGDMKKEDGTAPVPLRLIDRSVLIFLVFLIMVSNMSEWDQQLLGYQSVACSPITPITPITPIAVIVFMSEDGGDLHCCRTAGHCLRLSALQGYDNLLDNCCVWFYPCETRLKFTVKTSDWT